MFESYWQCSNHAPFSSVRIMPAVRARSPPLPSYPPLPLPCLFRFNLKFFGFPNYFGIIRNSESQINSAFRYCLVLPWFCSSQLSHGRNGRIELESTSMTKITTSGSINACLASLMHLRRNLRFPAGGSFHRVAAPGRAALVYGLMRRG